MTKQAIMDADGNVRKLSVPKICHIDAGEQNETNHKEVTVADKNKLFKRRMQLRDTEMEAHTHLHPSTHGRSVSFRNRPRPKLLNVDVCRPRRCSLPSPSANFLSVSYDNIPVAKESTSKQQPLRRVRSFKTTSKGGIVNRGDSFKRSANSINSTTGSVITCEQGANNALSQSRQRIDSTHSKDSGKAVSTGSSLEPDVYKVVMLGGKGVGKSSLTNQFMTSEFVAFENDQDVNDSDEHHVTVLLNSEESTLDIVDKDLDLDLDKQELSDGTFDAFAVVYSITDRVSYQSAVDILYDLRHELSIKDKPAILIANKIDLVRKRKVSKEEARSVAKQYNCKYCETSAALNHHVDELLVGILSQIRLHQTPGLQMDRPNFMERGQKE